MKNFKSFIAGAITMLTAVLLINTVFAAQINKTITAVYNDIKITVDGKQIIPKDAAGKAVEPFISDGITYLPVRAISEAVGYDVAWDGEKNTVILTKKAGQIPPPATTEKTTEPKTQTTTETTAKAKSKGVPILIEEEKEEEHDKKYYEDFPYVPNFGNVSEAKLYNETNHAPYTAIFQYEKFTQSDIDSYIKLLIENGFYFDDTINKAHEERIIDANNYTPNPIFPQIEFFPKEIEPLKDIYYKKDNITATFYNNIGEPYNMKCSILVGIHDNDAKSADSGNNLLAISIMQMYKN